MSKYEFKTISTDHIGCYFLQKYIYEYRKRGGSKYE
nr:MAG TPA: Pumilio-family RNA binding repeat [Caudoviricetes sp.]